MGYTDQKLQSALDINAIKNSMPAENSRKPPTIIIRSESGDEDSRVQLLVKIVKTEILLNIFLVLLLAVALYVSFVMRFDILKYFNQKTRPVDLQTDQSTEKMDGLSLDFRVVAAEPQLSAGESTPVVYITRHGFDIGRAFQTGPSGKLTAYGRLKNEIMGFLPYWAIPKLDQIDTRAVTSISYFGLEVDSSGEVIKYDTNRRPIEAWTYLQKDKNLENFIKKAQNSKIRVYLTLKAFNQDNIVALTTTPAAREQFIASALYLLNSKSLDGINLDFEYIGTPIRAVRDGFSVLVIDLYKAMKAQNPNSILTIDTFIDAASATRIHDIPVLAQNSDGLVIMGYDFRTPQSSVPGPIAPMEGAGLSIKGLMTSYLDKAPSEKLILAVPYYGYDWPVKQVGSGFEVSGVKQQVNVVAYGELANTISSTRILWDENAQVPWYTYQDSATSQTRVVYFENVRSLGIKYDFAKQNKLQGVAIWALGFDGQRTELAQTLIDKFSQ